MGGAALIVTAWLARGTVEPQPVSIPVSNVAVVAAHSARGVRRTWSLFMGRILSDARPRAVSVGAWE